MTTLADVLAAMGGGYLDPPESVGILSAAIATTTVTTFTMASQATPPKPGQILEIDDELLLIQNFSRSGATDTYTVARGVNGSVAATHLINAPVNAAPLYPRWKRKRAINRVLTDWLPQKLPRVQQDATQSFSAISDLVAVPAAAINILGVRYKPAGFNELIDLRYSRIKVYPTAILATGKGIRMFDVGPPSYTAYVTYTSLWTALAADTDALPADWVFGENMLAAGATAALLGAKFSKRATFDAAHSQRAEDKAGQSQQLARTAAQDAMLEFQSLVAGFMQDWEGAKVPAYWEGGA